MHTDLFNIHQGFVFYGYELQEVGMLLLLVSRVPLTLKLHGNVIICTL